MNYKALIKKQSTMIAIVVICLTIATIGVSYALFFQVETNTNNQVVTAGTLKVEFGSGSSAISATELVPMSDAEALSNSQMTGTIYIENQGSLAAKYEVSIGNDNESFEKRENKNDNDKLLSHDYLKVAAYLDGKLVVEPTTLSELINSEKVNDKYNLFEGTIGAVGSGENTATIVLKVWLTEDAPESIVGDFIYLNMDITSEVYEETPLPEGYQRVEYLQSSGTQWIDTGFIPNQDTRVIVDFEFTGNYSSFLFGARSGTTANAFTVNTSGGNLVSAYGNSGNDPYADVDKNRHLIDKNKNLFYVDGNLLTQPESTFTAPGTLEIFASYNGRTAGYMPSSAKIYKFKVFDNGTLVRNFIPCYKIEDTGNINGFYDVVNNVFYTNSGTGEFEVGAKVY